MEIKDIKECAEYLKDKVGIIIILLSGIILCGTTSICIFNFKLFLELSIEKILLLSCIISLPTYLMFLWLVGDKAYFKMNDIYLFCMEENILTFLLSHIFIKLSILKTFYPTSAAFIKNIFNFLANKENIYFNVEEIKKKES